MPEIVVIEEEPDCVSETAFPATAFPYASFSVTVIVAEELPSAATAAGLAATVDTAASTGPGTNVTEAVSVTSIESVVSCAV